MLDDFLDPCPLVVNFWRCPQNRQIRLPPHSAFVHHSLRRTQCLPFYGRKECFDRELVSTANTIESGSTPRSKWLDPLSVAVVENAKIFLRKIESFHPIDCAPSRRRHFVYTDTNGRLLLFAGRGSPLYPRSGIDRTRRRILAKRAWGRTPMQKSSGTANPIIASFVVITIHSRHWHTFSLCLIRLRPLRL